MPFQQTFFPKVTLFIVLLLAVFTVFSGCTSQPQQNIEQEQPVNKPAAIRHLPLSQPFRFVVIGDSGSAAKAQMDVVKAMEQEYSENPYSLVLMLGDNVYPDGNIAKYADKAFTRPYKQLRDYGIQFRPVLGNHDIQGGFQEEGIRFFGMPGPYYDFVEQDIHFFAINTNQFDSEQQHWLADELGKSHAKWKIVYGHHPIHSSGEHRSSPALIKDLEPILKRYHVDLYMAGHDHDYERFARWEGRPLYLISGGGGAYTRAFAKPVPHSLKRISTHHFIVFERAEDALRFRVIRYDGVEIDKGQIVKDAVEAQKPAA